jgi:SPP1 family predicted phage head-tail adaptor
VEAGELRHRLTVQTRTEVSDGHDGFTESWNAVPKRTRIAGKVRPLQGRDLERAKQTDARISHEVTVRYWHDYRTELAGGRARLIYHDRTDRTFEIVAPPVDVEERHEQLVLQCRELQ